MGNDGSSWHLGRPLATMKEAGILLISLYSSILRCKRWRMPNHFYLLYVVALMVEIFDKLTNRLERQSLHISLLIMKESSLKILMTDISLMAQFQKMNIILTHKIRWAEFLCVIEVFNKR